MKIRMLLIMVAFASELKEKDDENLILVKIEEDEYTKVHKKTSQYIGVYQSKERTANWQTGRRSKKENRTVTNGTYKDEKTAAHASDTLARKLIANGEQNHRLNFPDDNTEVYPEEKTSQYIGVSYTNEKTASWRASRRSRNEKKNVYNGSYKNEETAAHASDTLARKLMKNGEQSHKLNFPDDETEVNAGDNKLSSKYIGVTYVNRDKKWRANRWNKIESRQIYNGSYKDEETAAHASDTLARKFMENGEQNHKLNFPDDDTEVYPIEETASSIYIGVSYNKKNKLWCVYRHSKRESTQLYNGYYKDEETAAHASDTLARNLMRCGEQNHKLNFPDDDTERQTNKRKRSENEDLGHSHNK